MATAVEPARQRDAGWELLSHLRSLDTLLKRAVTRARELYGDTGDDSFHGIYISEEEIDSLVVRQGQTLSSAANVSQALDDFYASPQIDQLAKCWGFTEFDSAVFLLTVAPEIDLRYERIFAYLQDDVTKRKPTVDLALNLLCSSQEERIEQRSRFAPEAPLLQSGLLKLSADQAGEVPLIAHSLRLDERAIRLLLGDDSLDRKLASFCERSSFTPIRSVLGNENEILRRLQAFAGLAKTSNRPVRVLFTGPAMSSKRHAAQAFAETHNSVLLSADLERCETWRTETFEIASTLKREGILTGAVIFVSGINPEAADEAATKLFIDTLIDYPGVVVIASDSGLVAGLAGSDRFLTIQFSLPDFETRRDLWEQFTDAAGIPTPDDTLDALANNYQLSAEQIEAAVKTARQRLEWRITATGTLSATDLVSELLAATRGQTGVELAAITGRIKPVYRWSDIVLPEDTIAQLKEICQRVTQSNTVLERWGFGKKLSSGKGTSVLFAGPSGTGKTMAAEVIANELGLELFRIDLSSVVSKYIGETEKNLERVFSAAVRSNSVLLFDEADALFGKRSQVHDAHDRYANVEISYLLQKMEAYEGITILTSNLRGNIDDGFWRRLAFTVHFPFPDENTRREIWRRIWPTEIELDADVEIETLAHRFNLSGGNIRNIGLAAAYLAAAEARPVKMFDILHATRREYTKVGKSLTPAELEDVVN